MVSIFACSSSSMTKSKILIKQKHNHIKTLTEDETGMDGAKHLQIWREIIHILLMLSGDRYHTYILAVLHLKQLSLKTTLHFYLNASSHAAEDDIHIHCSVPVLSRDRPPLLLSSHGFHDYEPKSGALLETRRPMIKPNRPRTELKISMTRILTNL